MSSSTRGSRYGTAAPPSWPRGPTTSAPTWESAIKLHDEAALLTGATSGISLAIGRRYLDEGARVLLVDRDQAALQAAMAGLPDQARSFCADVAAAPSAAAMVAECERLWGGLDICVCNAGMI